MVVLQVLPFSNVSSSPLKTQAGLSSDSTNMPSATNVAYRQSMVDMAPLVGHKRKRHTDSYSDDDSIIMEKPMKKKATLSQEAFGQNMFKSFVKSALDELDKVWRLQPGSLVFH